MGEWVKGALNNAPDTLSRNTNSDPQPLDMLAEYELENTDTVATAETRAILCSTYNTGHLEDLEAEADQDPEYQKLKHYIQVGYPQHRHQLPSECKRYWNVRSQLLLNNNLILFGCHLLIPMKMRKKVLTQLHQSRQGIIRTRVLA